MTDFVAFLRAVNVGGVRVAMRDLVALADALGWGEAETFAVSGNLLFTAGGAPATLATRLQVALSDHAGQEVPVTLRDGAQLRALLAECPFTAATGSHVHGFLPFGPMVPDMALLAGLRADGEELVFTPSAAWLHAPEGVARSALARRLEEVMGVQATGRNLNTLRKLVVLLDAREGRC